MTTRVHTIGIIDVSPRSIPLFCGLVLAVEDGARTGVHYSFDWLGDRPTDAALAASILDHLAGDRPTNANVVWTKRV